KHEEDGSETRELVASSAGARHETGESGLRHVARNPFPVELGPDARVARPEASARRDDDYLAHAQPDDADAEHREPCDPDWSRRPDARHEQTGQHPDRCESARLLAAEREENAAEHQQDEVL